jgi:hypothetical protein
MDGSEVADTSDVPIPHSFQALSREFRISGKVSSIMSAVAWQSTDL